MRLFLESPLFVQGVCCLTKGEIGNVEYGELWIALYDLHFCLNMLREHLYSHLPLTSSPLVHNGQFGYLNLWGGA